VANFSLSPPPLAFSELRLERLLRAKLRAVGWYPERMFVGQWMRFPSLQVLKKNNNKLFAFVVVFLF
jgi:hypothetical protein